MPWLSSRRLHPLRRNIADALMRLCFGPPVTPSFQTLPQRGIHRILICHVSHALGNALLLTPLLQELENTWPGAQIDIITRSQVGQALYSHHDNVHQVFQLPSHGVGHPRQWLRELHHMRKVHYDLVIDPDTLSQTNRLLQLKAHAVWTLGFSAPRKNGAVTHAINVPQHIPHQGKRPVYLLRSGLGRTCDATCYPPLDIRLSDREYNQGKRMLDRIIGPRASSRIIGIFANATGPKQQHKDWWIALLNRFEQCQPTCQLLEIVPMSGQSLLDSRYPSLFSTDIRRLAGVLANLDACISLDCGIMHLACAAGVPTLGIFTDTAPEEWQPYGPKHRTIQAARLSPESTANELADQLTEITTPG